MESVGGRSEDPLEIAFTTANSASWAPDLAFTTASARLVDSRSGGAAEFSTMDPVRPTLRDPAKNLQDVPLFSAAQAAEWSISDKDLAILVRRGLILRLDRGWYSTMVAAEPDDLHVLRTTAALHMHGAAAASAHSAVLLHGLPLARTDLTTVELVRAGPGHGQRRRGVRVRSCSGLPTVDVRVPIIGGTAVAVSIPHAIVGTALVNNPLGALVAGDAALHAKRCSPESISAALADARGCHGVARARQILEFLDPRHESSGETLTHWELRQLGWDLVPQWPVRVGRRTFRFDLRVTGEMVAIEYDGRDKMKLSGAQEKLEARQTALEDLGWEFVRVIAEDLEDPPALSARVHEAVLRSRRAA